VLIQSALECIGVIRNPIPFGRIGRVGDVHNESAVGIRLPRRFDVRTTAHDRRGNEQKRAENPELHSGL
jgi:hypothetical protein